MSKRINTTIHKTTGLEIPEWLLEEVIAYLMKDNYRSYETSMEKFKGFVNFDIFSTQKSTEDFLRRCCAAEYNHDFWRFYW